MPYTYDNTTGQYFDGDRVVPPVEQLRAIEKVIDDTKLRLAVLGQRRAEGTMPTLDWRIAVQNELKRAHIAAALVAHGGVNNLDPSTRGFVGSRLRTQYDFLSRLALDTGPGNFDGRAMTRLAMYASAAHNTYEAIRRRDAQTRGQAFERNLIDPAAAHCGECVDLTGRGWVPVGTLPEPGSRTCLTNCRCSLEYSVDQPVGATA